MSLRLFAIRSAINELRTRTTGTYATTVLPAPTIIMDVVRNSIECFLDDHPYDGIFMFLTVPRLERSLDMTFEELCQEAQDEHARYCSCNKTISCAFITTRNWVMVPEDRTLVDATPAVMKGRVIPQVQDVPSKLFRHIVFSVRDIIRMSFCPCFGYDHISDDIVSFILHTAQTGGAIHICSQCRHTCESR